MRRGRVREGAFLRHSLRLLGHRLCLSPLSNRAKSSCKHSACPAIIPAAEWGSVSSPTGIGVSDQTPELNAAERHAAAPLQTSLVISSGPGDHNLILPHPGIARRGTDSVSTRNAASASGDIREPTSPDP